MARSDSSTDWTILAPGDRLTVMKRSPGGSEATRYAGEVIARDDLGSWVVVHATWAQRRIELDGLAFCPGDDLLEWFSPVEDFNAFSVYAPDGHLRGWYANVTYPARLDLTTEPPLLEWHDLYVDLVGLPDGTFTVRDEDELAGSGLERGDPEFYGRILRARDELVRRFSHGIVPFVVVPKLAP